MVPWMTANRCLFCICICLSQRATGAEFMSLECRNSSVQFTSVQFMVDGPSPSPPLRPSGSYIPLSLYRQQSVTNAEVNKNIIFNLTKVNLIKLFNLIIVNLNKLFNLIKVNLIKLYMQLNCIILLISIA